MERKEKMKRKDMHVNEHERLSIKTYLYIEISGTYRVYNDTLIILKNQQFTNDSSNILKYVKT
jgi:hypothetical protein